MRIQIATPYQSPDVVGGISTYVDILKQGLVEAGVEVTVAREIDTSSDLVHCHAHWYVLRDSLKLKKVSGFTFHTIPELSRLKWKAFSGFLAKCRFIVHLSDYSRLVIGRATGLGGQVVRPSVIPKTVSKEYARQLKSRLKIGSRYPILCMISPLEFGKKCDGIKSLICSLKLIDDELDPHLLIVGGGSRMSEMMEFTKAERAGSKVSFLGRVPDAWDYLALCDVYTHISLMDNSPLAVLEAMSIGKPVVSVDVGGIKELLGTDGIITGTSPAEIAEAVSSAAGNPADMRRIARTLKKRFERVFGLKRMVSEHIRVYEDALGWRR